MHFILKSISVVFHPLIIPLLGVLFYFSKTPRYIPTEIMQAKLVSTCLLSIVLPLLIYALLKNLNKVNSIRLHTTQERILPFGLGCIIFYLIIKKVFTSNDITELYFFFIGILIAIFTCFILAIFKFKASIHLMAIASLFMFYLGLSLHYQININGTLALLSIITGAVATSRLHLKAHNYTELIVGFCIGFFSQLLMFNYWL